MMRWQFRTLQFIPILSIAAAIVASGCSSSEAKIANSHETYAEEHAGHEGHKHLLGGHYGSDELGAPDTIEVFTGGCDLCTEAARESVAVAKDLGLRVVEYKIDSPEGKQYKLKSAPSIVFEGTVLFDHLPSREELEAALFKAMTGKSKGK